jgi:molybdate transport system regulatory protein
MRVCYRVWLDSEGKAFGEGPYRLLQGVLETGSLHRAAGQMHMSYRKAWNTVNQIEKRLGFALLERKVGGTSGGGSTITPEGKTLMLHYEKFRHEVKQSLEQIYKKHFDYVGSVPDGGGAPETPP